MMLTMVVACSATHSQWVWSAMLAYGSCNMLLCGLVGGFHCALHASANSFFHIASIRWSWWS
jgi:hypothetical protein